jgi:hypothetical protein
MSQEMETILRKSLDEVDRIRRWQIAGIFFTILTFLAMGSSVVFTLNKNHPDPDFWRMLMANAELMTFNVAFGVLGVCLFITRMTKKILKAIELSSKQ